MALPVFFMRGEKGFWGGELVEEGGVTLNCVQPLNKNGARCENRRLD